MFTGQQNFVPAAARCWLPLFSRFLLLALLTPHASACFSN